MFEQYVRRLSFCLLDGKRKEATTIVKIIMGKYDSQDWAQGQFSSLENVNYERWDNASFFNMLGMICERYLSRKKIQDQDGTEFR